MSISQDRMLALIAAAEAFHQGLQRACQQIASALAEAETSGNALAILAELAAGARPEFFVENYTPHCVGLAIEAKHFHEKARYNTWKRGKAEQRRRDLGIEPRRRPVQASPSQIARQHKSPEHRALLGALAAAEIELGYQDGALGLEQESVVESADDQSGALTLAPGLDQATRDQIDREAQAAADSGDADARAREIAEEALKMKTYGEGWGRGE